ncbi:hypothetical protein BVG16_08065 [Paenibacillus selenitireducens]|jgi:hypothetical protein|uniref:Uncharacterized protein n=1 Tax=Paenibacillus selenitireducens TaxID=1324314 RepID=A0A1T2XGN9_9BACL|nr:hypothetical protein [Paenibacillus selenitireducens]OPA79049.1 hypothetical protein BVG16_08065 [Paenibacillus selenitireducens]
MKSSHSTFDQVQIVGKLADLKEEHYRNTLALCTLIELLVDKGLFTREEIAAKANEIDQIMVYPPYPMV